MSQLLPIDRKWYTTSLGSLNAGALFQLLRTDGIRVDFYTMFKEETEHETDYAL